MDDSFALGDPAKHPVRLGRSHAPKPGGPSSVGRVVVVVVTAAVVGAGAFVVLKLTAEGGRQAADAAQTAVGQIEVANDLAAQDAVRRTTLAATALFAESGTFPSADALAASDPTLTYTTGASTGPSVASVASAGSGFAVAVASESGTCLWSRIDEQGLTTFGSGAPCTGQAAMAAAEPAW